MVDEGRFELLAKFCENFPLYEHLRSRLDASTYFHMRVCTFVRLSNGLSSVHQHFRKSAENDDLNPENHCGCILIHHLLPTRAH